MARLELVEGCSLRRARRVMTERGSGFRLTLRWGRLYTMKRVRCVQPDSVAQLRCRALLSRANELARRDFEDEVKVEYWKKKAEEMGYKTARGCARAWYVGKLKEEALREEAEEMRIEEEALKKMEKMEETLRSEVVEKRIERETGNEVENMGRVEEVERMEKKLEEKEENVGRVDEVVRRWGEKEMTRGLRIEDVERGRMICGKVMRWADYRGVVRWRRALRMSKL